MIYTVTFNPSLDYIVAVDDFQLGLTNRTSSELILPGGKGINVSTLLMNLGIESTALGFMAGFTGDEIVRELQEMGVKSDFIRIDEGISRINLKLKSIDGTEINGSGPAISADKVEQLMVQLDALGEGDVLFLAGSIPSSMPDDMYRRIMARLEGKGVMIVVDATKDLLLNVLEYHPFLIKPNNHELGDIFGVELKTREEVVPYGKKLQEMGARNVLISMAGGIYDRAAAKHAFSLGVDGIQVATRFVTTEECDADIRYKEAYIRANKEDIQIVKSPVGMPGRAIMNSFMERVMAGERISPKKCLLCMKGCKPSEIPYCITESLLHAAKGEVDEALLFCGAEAWRAEKIETVEEVMDDLLQA